MINQAHYKKAVWPIQKTLWSDPPTHDKLLMLPKHIFNYLKCELHELKEQWHEYSYLHPRRQET